MGARRQTAEAKKPGNSPRASPEVEGRGRVPEDGYSEGGKRRTGRENMGDCVGSGPTKRAVRRRGPANPMKVRLEKKAVSVATKAGEMAADRAGKGQLLDTTLGT